MRTFLLLTRVQMLGLLNSLAPVKSGLSHNQRTLRVVGIAAAAILLGLLFVAYLGLMAVGLALVGLARILPALAVMLGSLAGVVFTFFKANGTLFGFKDYDLVMSLPVSRRMVVASRMATLMGMALALATCAMTPLYIVYFLMVPSSAFSIAAAVLSVILAPLAPTALATFASYAITWVAARFHHASLAYVVLGMVAILAFVGACFVFSASANNMSTTDAIEAVGQVGLTLESSIASAYPPAAWAGAAVVQGSPVAFAGFAIFTLGVSGACLEIMQRRYAALNATLAARSRRSGAHGHRTKRTIGAGAHAHTKTPFWAIVVKEVRTLLGIPTYAFNCLVGYVFTIGFAVLLASMGLQDLLASGTVNGVELGAERVAALMGNIQLALPWVLGFCGLTCTSSVPSVSIEGRSAWLMATAPVSTRTMLGAKLASSAIPFVASLALASGILLASGQVTPLGALECLLVGFGTFLLWVCVGMRVDVKHPNLTWINPQDVIKRGAPMLSCILGGLVYVLALGTAIFVASLIFGLAVGHALSLIVGIVSIALGALVFHRMVATTPSLHI